MYQSTPHPSCVLRLFYRSGNAQFLAGMDQVRIAELYFVLGGF